MSGRDTVLARIAAAMAVAPPADLPYETVTRAYRDRPAHPGADLVELLVDRLVDYRAEVRTCAAEELPAIVATVLAARGIRRLAVPPGLPGSWLSAAEVAVSTDDPEAPLTVSDLDGVDGVLSGCAVAVAETGTLILDASPDQGRRALTLVPDYYLCVVQESAIVPDVPEALGRLDPTRPLTFISGPSATSDIELNRVEGVHGPRTLDVIVITKPPAG